MEKLKEKFIFGCIADDFTGASDVASFLVKGGMNTILFNGLPSENILINDDVQGIVIALKTRTMDKELAVKESLEATRWLKEKGANQLYVKYCSTFDSTREGNIGPILDSILDEFNIPYTILCPALPVNGRVVKDGILYVNGVPLSESHMKNHPLTPMWDSSIINLMKPQSKYDSFLLSNKTISSKKEVFDEVNKLAKDMKHFYLVPDFEINEDGKNIIETFGDLPLLSGGSGLMYWIAKKNKLNEAEYIKNNTTTGKAIILAGSCSVATLSQIEHYKKFGKTFKLDPMKLLNNEQSLEEVYNILKNSNEDNILIYSSESAEEVKKAQENGAEKVSSLLEEAMANIAKQSLDFGYNRIIVAGGETSGAVTKGLGFSNYEICDSVAPGVPIMIPNNNKKIRLVLKSGNFGQENFFNLALDMTKE